MFPGIKDQAWAWTLFRPDVEARFQRQAAGLGRREG